MNELRLGMIGCGQISERFLEWARMLAGVRFTATCAAHLASAEYAARRYGCPRWYDDHHELLADPEVDAVVIATPHALHAGQALDSVRAGKHVLIEKPMATRWDEAVALARAAESAGVTLFPLPFVSYPEHLLAQRFMREEVIGKVVAAEAHLSLPGPPRANWYYSAEAEGGAMVDCAVYPLSDLACTLGPAARVTALANTLIPNRRTGDGGRVHGAVDDNVSLLLEYPTGQQAMVRSCWGPAFVRKATILYGRHGTIFLREGGKRVVVHSLLGPVVGGAPIQFLGLDHCYEFIPRPLEPEEDILGLFVSAVRSGQPGPCNLPQALQVVEQMMRGYDSALTGQAQDLTTSFDLSWERPVGLLDLSGPDFL
ncbi:MAG TPA: Gfo/Idh/MocA family oxidoreductase [Chloroflexota bacterium]|nr:Gfo/Idh/MocA family oxidoreductase [Chloroflexota bacterium]